MTSTVSSKDQALNKSVQAALEVEPAVNLHVSPVRVETEGSTVILSGEVENIAAKRRAVLAAQAVPGVREVIDNLQLTPSDHMGIDEVLLHVRDALLAEPALCNHRLITINKKSEQDVAHDPADAVGEILIGVEEPRQVVLSGRVNSLSHRRLAELLAWWVPGTTDVKNELVVEPAEQDNDGEILDSVELALEKDHLVDASDVTLSCADAVVTLRGGIPTGRQRLLAECDVWYINGVRDVVNELQPVDPA